MVSMLYPLRVLTAWFLCMWLAASALAAEVSLQLPATELGPGQSVVIEVQVVDGEPLAVPSIDLPDSMSLTYLGPSNMMIHSGGKLTRVIRYNWQLKVGEEGRFEVGPARVDLASGQALESLAVPLTVVSSADDLAGALEAGISYMPEEAWEGEVVVFRYRIRSRFRPSRTRWFPFEWDGLLAPRDGDRPRREYSVRDPAGDIWVDDTLVPLVAAATGDLTMKEAVVQVHLPTGDRLDPLGLFGRSRVETMVAGPAPLQVKPLPAAPDGFTGLVGDFKVQVRWDRQQVAVGESVTRTVRIVGDGALDGFSLPKPEVDGVRFYEGATTSRAGIRDGNYLASATLETAVVPTRAGRLVVPPLALVTFSPTKGTWDTLQVPGTMLEVAPGSGAVADVQSFAPTVEPDADIVSAPPDIRPPRSRGLMGVPWPGSLIPGAVFLAGLPGLLLWGRRGASVWAARRRASLEPRAPVRDPKARLDNLPADREARLRELDAALREWLSLVTDQELESMDRQRAVDELGEPLRQRVLEVSGALDRARFAGASADGLDGTLRQLFDTTGEPS